MIRINLLPSEDRKTTRRIKLPSISGSGALWTVVVVGAYAAILLSISALQAKSIKELDGKIIEAKEESARLAPQLAKIRKLTREREEVNRRLGVIASLDRDRYLRVRVMNDLSTKLPANCWLTNVTESSGTGVTIEGVTFSNYIIADFMNNIDKSGLFEDTTLRIAEEGVIEDFDVIKFTLNTRIVN